MKKVHLKKSIIILFIFIVAIGFIGYAIQTKGGTNAGVQAAVNDSLAVVDEVINGPKRWLNSRSNTISKLIGTYEENRKLKDEIEQYDEMKQQAKNQTQEIERLKVEVELNETLTSYERVTAATIVRSPKTWQDVLVVDKGSSDGVNKNMAVMSQKGLIGRVMEVDTHSSEIQLLTADTKSSNHFPIKISSAHGDSLGILNNYDAKTKQLIASQVTREKDIKEGDIVRTSGLGGNSPADLVVGTVTKIKPNNNGIDLEVYIQPYAQMYDISFVTIIKGMVED